MAFEDETELELDNKMKTDVSAPQLEKYGVWVKKGPENLEITKETKSSEVENFTEPFLEDSIPEDKTVPDLSDNVENDISADKNLTNDEALPVDDEMPDLSAFGVTDDMMAAFEAPAPEKTEQESSETESVDMGDFFSSDSGDGDVDLSAFLGDGESIDFDDFMGGDSSSSKEPEIIDEEPLNIDLQFDDDFVLETQADPVSEVEFVGFDGESDGGGMSFDDLFDNIQDESSVSNDESSQFAGDSGTTEVSFDDFNFDTEISEETATAPSANEEETMPVMTESKPETSDEGFDVASEFDDLLSSLDDASPQTETPEEAKEKFHKKQDYEMTVTMDVEDLDEEQEEVQEEETENQEDLDDISLFQFSEDIEYFKELEKNGNKPYSGGMRVLEAQSGDDFDEIDQIIADSKISFSNTEDDSDLELVEEVESVSDDETENELPIEEEIPMDDISLDDDTDKTILPEINDSDEKPRNGQEIESENEDAFTDMDLSLEAMNNPELEEDEEIVEDEEAVKEENDSLNEDDTILDFDFNENSLDEEIASDEADDIAEQNIQGDEILDSIDDEYTAFHEDDINEDDNYIEESDNSESDYISEEVDFDEPEFTETEEEETENLVKDSDEMGNLDQSVSDDQDLTEVETDISEEDEMGEPVKNDSNESAILEKIAAEISSLRSEISNLRSEFDNLKLVKEPAGQEGNISLDEKPVEDSEPVAEDENTALEESQTENAEIEEPVIEEKPEDNESNGSLGFFSDDMEDETIALSGDELDNILNNADFTTEDYEGENKTDDLPTDSDNLTPDVEEDKEPSIADEIPSLSDNGDLIEDDSAKDSLGDAETIAAENFEGLDDYDDSASEESADFDLDEEDLTEPKPEDLEIDNRIDSEDDSEIDVPKVDDVLVEADTNDFIESIENIEPTISESLTEDKLNYLEDDNQINDSQEEDEQNEPTEEVFKSTQWDNEVTDSEDKESVPTVSDIASKDKDVTSQMQTEIKSVLRYMDQLLENLPEEKIEEFARSEYFDTYKKLFSELGLSD